MRSGVYTAGRYVCGRAAISGHKCFALRLRVARTVCVRLPARGVGGVQFIRNNYRDDDTGTGVGFGTRGRAGELYFGARMFRL